jgi:alpha-beta hydrolase superfamily lysophospholipase
MKSGPFDAADGTKLHAHWYPAQGKARAGAIIVHGYADHGGRYAEVGERLAARGFAAMTFDYRGHGRAQGARGHCDRFDEFVSDLERACAQARAALGELPLALVAHSHGGLIALRALCEPGREPRGVTCIALTSPFLGIAVKVSPLKILAARVSSRLVPRLALKNEIDVAVLTHDEQRLAERRGDTLCHGVATARWFTEATGAQEFVLSHVGRLAVPSLWLVAGSDKLVDSDVARRAFDRAGGDKRLELYPDLYHEVWNERDREPVLNTLVEWLCSRFPSG